ncbi:hypothetical protein D3C72_2600560 [compost metagenome]
MMASSLDETMAASMRRESEERFISVMSEMKPSSASRVPSSPNTPWPFSQAQRSSPSR